MIRFAPRNSEPPRDRTARPAGPLGGLLDQFYDSQNKKLRLGGIIGALLGGVIGGSMLGSTGTLAIFGAVIGGILGSWGGNAAQNTISRMRSPTADRPQTPELPGRQQQITPDTQKNNNFQDVSYNIDGSLPGPTSTPGKPLPPRTPPRTPYQ
jgi:hypothetical protein